MTTMKTVHENNVSEEERELYDRWLKEDGDEWEDGDFGKNPVHAARVSDVEADELNQGIRGKATRQKRIALMMPPELLAELRDLAKRRHVGYQTLIKVLLSEAVERNRLD